MDLLVFFYILKLDNFFVSKTTLKFFICLTDFNFKILIFNAFFQFGDMPETGVMSYKVIPKGKNKSIAVASFVSSSLI